MSNVWVVTSTELGWDCVVGVFDGDKFTREELQEHFTREQAYVVHYGHKVETSLEEYE